jgi:hypothetical protein
MIPITAAVAAIGVAQEFDKRQLILDAVPGTPLAALNECSTLNISDVAGVLSFDPDATSFSNRFSSDSNCHEEALINLSTDIATHVRSHLNFAKNTVRSIIEELVTEVKADIDALPVNSQFSAEIIQVDLPEPLTVSSFEDAIMEYKDTEYYNITQYMSLPSQTATEVIERMMTGHAVTDKAIATWAAKKGESFFQYIWDCVFTNAPTDKKFETLISDTADGADNAIAIYLLAAKLYDNPLEGTNVSLSNFNKTVADIRNQAALRLVHSYEEYLRFKTTGLLVISAINNKIMVVGDTYRQWLTEGGNNAVLFGSMLSAKSDKFVLDINNNKAEHLQVWERQNWMLTVAEKNKRFLRLKEVLSNRIIKVVMENYQQCYAHLVKDGVTTPNMAEFIEFQRRLGLYLNTIKEGYFNNLWKLCQELVCHTVFYYTDADKILDGIEDACNENKDINIREAALISTIAYVTDYVCDQLKISNI